MNNNSIRLLLAEDHPIVREGLRAILGRQQDMRVVAEASNGWEAFELFRKHRPDVALMDLRMPVMGGLRATEAILREFPGSRILVLTTYDGDEEISQALKTGACGYLLKDSREAELVGAVRAAHAGRRVISPAVAVRLAERLPGSELTDRETDVLGLIVGGNSNKVIAAALGITEGTVKGYINSLLGKLHVTDRTQAATVALRRGFFHLGDEPSPPYRKLDKGH